MDSKLVKFYTQKVLINPTFKTVGLHPHLGTALGWKEPKLASVGLSFSQKLTQLDLAILTQEPILTLVLLFNYFFFCLYLFRGVSLRGKLSFLGTPWSHSLSTATVWSASHWNSFTGAAGFKSPAQGHHSDSHDNNEGTGKCCLSLSPNRLMLPVQGFEQATFWTQASCPHASTPTSMNNKDTRLKPHFKMCNTALLVLGLL